MAPTRSCCSSESFAQRKAESSQDLTGPQRQLEKGKKTQRGGSCCSSESFALWTRNILEQQREKDKKTKIVL